MSEWQGDYQDDFDQIKQLYETKKSILPTLNEDQTEEEILKPVLGILGFTFISQVTTHGKGRVERPDFALFPSDQAKMEAFKLKDDEKAFYPRVTAIAEAKYWGRPLSKVTKGDRRDSFKNENPSFQIVNYLTGTGVDWGILTNGKEWRLYYRQASSIVKESYDTDLEDILESGDLEKFKYFWLFFRRNAFVPDPQGNSFLDRVREGSLNYAIIVEKQLKKLVFEQVFPNLAGGFCAAAIKRRQTATPK